MQRSARIRILYCIYVLLAATLTFSSALEPASDEVIFYQNLYQLGDSWIFDVGEEVPSLIEMDEDEPGMKNVTNATSIAVGADVIVKIYSEEDFDGRKVELLGPVSVNLVNGTEKYGIRPASLRVLQKRSLDQGTGVTEAPLQNAEEGGIQRIEPTDDIGESLEEQADATEALLQNAEDEGSEGIEPMDDIAESLDEGADETEALLQNAEKGDIEGIEPTDDIAESLDELADATKAPLQNAENGGSKGIEPTDDIGESIDQRADPTEASFQNAESEGSEGIEPKDDIGESLDKRADPMEAPLQNAENGGSNGVEPTDDIGELFHGELKPSVKDSEPEKNDQPEEDNVAGLHDVDILSRLTGSLGSLEGSKVAMINPGHQEAVDKAKTRASLGVFQFDGNSAYMTPAPDDMDPFFLPGGNINVQELTLGTVGIDGLAWSRAMRSGTFTFALLGLSPVVQSLQHIATTVPSGTFCCPYELRVLSNTATIRIGGIELTIFPDAGSSFESLVLTSDAASGNVTIYGKSHGGEPKVLKTHNQAGGMAFHPLYYLNIGGVGYGGLWYQGFAGTMNAVEFFDNAIAPDMALSMIAYYS